jgi:UDP-GlcNAc3NAcA epimerase
LSLRILTIIGARPQFIKAAALSRVFRENFTAEITEVICHTGQHFDDNMSNIFFAELGIPRPAVTLETRSGSQGKTTGQMMGDLDNVIHQSKPDLVLVYGDTNSTLAAALSASKLGVPIAHVEAGMRSWNRQMPEEINRVVTDHLSEWNFSPSQSAIDNLKAEGLGHTAHLVGDIMQDALEMFSAADLVSSEVIQKLLGDVEGPDRFILATFHRQENTANTDRLRGIVEGLERISQDLPVLLPMHPRLRMTLQEQGLDSFLGPKVRVIEPVSYIQMIRLVKMCDLVITDSGGLQKEAFFLKTPCVTVRDETEWVETVQLGWNTLSKPDANSIKRAASLMIGTKGSEGTPYGPTGAGIRIADLLLHHRS